MSDRVAFLDGRAFPRLALTGLALLWLSGCAVDSARFDGSNPFSNPFDTKTADAAPAGAAPSGQIAAAPLPPQGVASASSSATSTAKQAVAGSAAGWTAAGGTPVVVAQGETLDTLSRRYGVPSAALLSANGLSNAADVKGGMHMVVPVYNAGGRAVAAAPAGKAVAEASAKPAKARAEDVAANDGAKTKKTKAETKAEAKLKDKAPDKTKAESAAVASKPQDKAADAKAAPVVAKADPAKPPAAGKKPAIDDTPTGNVDPKAAGAKAPVTAEEADASGSTPEFRWPARGRIIEGFKAGGNDGINISVPSGTSVRAAENGVVVYSGDGLKGYGNLVLIKHPNGFVSAYANNGELDVKRGDTVKRGQIIAKSGDTGNVNAPQLHFELRKGSTPVDPTNYLAGL